MGRVISYLAACFLITACFSFTLAQNIIVTGNISTSAEPVKYAQITFTNINDTSKSFTTLTDTAGNYQLSIIVTDVDDNYPAVPSAFELAQNYPNPFSNSTAITYKLNEQTDVSITIYNILGQEIKRYTMPSQHAGIHGVTWDGTNNFSQKVSPGVYFYQLHNGKDRLVKKMVYGLGGNGLKPEIFSNTYFQNNRNFKHSTANTFLIEINNTDDTSPQIIPAESSETISFQDTILNFEVEENKSDFSLCYLRIDTTLWSDGKTYINWEIYLNNIRGTNPKNITNWRYADDQAQWSPDGKYIAFMRDGDIYLYDTVNDTTIGLLTSDTIDETGPVWTPDSKRIIYHYHVMGQPWYGYIVDADGSNNRQLTYIGGDPYFYQDNYTFVYEADNDSIYRTNLDGTHNEFLLDIKTLGKNYVGTKDFNPYTNELLILADPIPQVTDLLITYNIDNNKIDTVSVADSGWIYYRPGFSNDYKKIILAEIKYGDPLTIYRLLLIDIEKKTKTIIKEFPSMDEMGSYFLHFSPLTLSPDDKYLAYTKDTQVPGEEVWWLSFLYVIEIETKKETYIDMGVNALWNPMKSH